MLYKPVLVCYSRARSFISLLPENNQNKGCFPSSLPLLSIHRLSSTK
nr:MAG TPA: hypothetical protein [Caudoviricetes sp.]